jgi:hypothetical protein
MWMLPIRARRGKDEKGREEKGNGARRSEAEMECTHEREGRMVARMACLSSSCATTGCELKGDATENTAKMSRTCVAQEARSKGQRCGQRGVRSRRPRRAPEQRSVPLRPTGSSERLAAAAAAAARSPNSGGFSATGSRAMPSGACRPGGRADLEFSASALWSPVSVQCRCSLLACSLDHCAPRSRRAFRRWRADTDASSS